MYINILSKNRWVRQFTPSMILYVLVLYLFPSFLFSLRISFGENQALQILTKFINKNVNIYNNKSISLNSLLNVLSHHIDLL